MPSSCVLAMSSAIMPVLLAGGLVMQGHCGMGFSFVWPVLERRMNCI